MAFRITICFCLFLLSPSLSSLNPPLCNSHDSIALFHFKNSLSLDHSASMECDEFHGDDNSYTIQFKNSSYPKTASWGNDSNCCLWDGITCDSMSGHVIGLDLTCSWIQGQLHPNNSLFQLSHLQTLNLAHNNFSGSLISSHFGGLSTLMHLNLSYSTFAGEISPKIAELFKLVSLDLSMNGFEGLSLRLEPSTWEKLALNMTDMRELVLDDVNMSSIAPSSLSLKSLNILSLKRCRFDGPIPIGFGNLTQLTDLNLAGNNFSGELSFLSNIQSLTSLDLSDNYFNGLLPNSIGHLKSLNFLGLQENQFHGPIPTSLGTSLN
ncbi:receptor-like protein 43 [Neltuma alba]|uniref:receptor-like protein 43 n=1 Tax=Neltuma alba TaxID=207710 RepID=UPI0010A53458|nr:receptor-like protein 43 [Prosopis alba]